MAGIPPADTALEVTCCIVLELSTQVACLALCEDRSSMSDKVAGVMRRNTWLTQNWQKGAA